MSVLGVRAVTIFDAAFYFASYFRIQVDENLAAGDSRLPFASFDCLGTTAVVHLVAEHAPNRLRNPHRLATRRKVDTEVKIHLVEVQFGELVFAFFNVDRPLVGLNARAVHIDEAHQLLVELDDHQSFD